MPSNRRIPRLAFATFAVFVTMLGHGITRADDLSAGGYHAVFAAADHVKGLGDGTYGQLGETPGGIPATVSGLSDIEAVAAGGFSTLALKDDGTVWFLGETTLQHTTPHGTPDAVFVPSQVPGLSGITAIAAGHRHFLALNSDTGALYAWGHNGSGEVGDGGLLDAAAPVLVLDNVLSIAAGDGFSLAVGTDGTLWAWGRNGHGQLGTGDLANRTVPTRVSGVTTAEAVAAGGLHSLALMSGGGVLAAGNNSHGQLGNNGTSPALTFAQVQGLPNALSIDAGYHHSAAIGTDGKAYLWGRNHEGQCGGGDSSPVGYPVPQDLAGLSVSPTAIACGYHFTLLKLADGSVLGMGSNSDGQLDGVSMAVIGDSPKALSPQPTPFTPDLTAPSAVSLSPGNGETGVFPPANLVIGFSEPVIPGPGRIRIKTGLGNALVETVAANSASVMISGSSVTIDLSANLENGAEYYVEIDGDAFTDATGNPYPGFLGSSAWKFTTRPAQNASASLIAHYRFDTRQGGVSPDSVTQNGATLGSRVRIDNTVTGAIGGGALELLGAGASSGPGDGAVTTNSFSWANAARTVTFWCRAKNPNANTADGTFVSFGDTSGSGKRFDIKEQASTNLRVEIQGTGADSSPAIDDGAWHFIAVTVPAGGTIANVAMYVDGGSNLNPGGGNAQVLTGAGPIAFGDSILTVGTNDRVPNGYLDDFQLYDRVLTSAELAGLRDNPGAVVGSGIDGYAKYIGDPEMEIPEGQRGFEQDPDGDGIKNGLEAWFGTDAGKHSAGLRVASQTGGQQISFTHPQNPDRPTDVAGFYEWSTDLVNWYVGDGVQGPADGTTLVFTRAQQGSSTVVSGQLSKATPKVFVRAGARYLGE